MKVDLIVRNARIDTRDAAHPHARSLAVLHGRVVALDDDVEGLDARETIDAGGLAVLPGFNDVHAHSVWFGTTLMEADLSAVASFDDIYAAIEAQAASTKPGDWVVAAGYNPVLLGSTHPDRERLDAASGGRPVWIKHASGHSGQASARGLALAGVGDRDVPAMEGGVIRVDETGRPTGVLEERAMKLVQDILLPYPLAAIEQALQLATEHYAREGLTSVTDAGVAGGWIGHAPAELAAYQAARDAGRLRTRMQVMPVMDALGAIAGHDEEPARRGFGAGMRTGWGDEWLQLGPVKVFTDGSILGRTAQMREEYEGCPGYHGYLQDDPEAMRTRVLEAAAAGWSLALHAVGDAALDFALDAIEAAVRAHGTPSVPNRVEHGMVVRPDQLERLAALRIACVVQPSFIPSFGEGIRGPVGEQRGALSIRARSQLDAGMPLAFSSDRPVAAGAPLLGIQAFVQRISEEGLVYGEHERISVDEAVHAATVGSAEVTGQQAQKGRLAPGQLADLVLLGAHPSEVDAGEISAIPVRATIAGGAFTHRDAELG
ncbi:amidohydrolase [Agrococcus baldri]|uniref:Amidohydrolase n=1 Tax=Agrococcus baldri TaxID=153730 RepID=A0AA87RCA5_9MICO|nr:amidohydrolase [Agrococcus baldri]GEK80181.1 amidohydrolase [Agrococcus baldri]